ncbi:MAG: hypothetical protein BIFFINMI_01920 [Phycisphaerae bacterium]|nr:hypothetical protein [Phycisphaerae bacterium]
MDALAEITADERARLRELARRQADYAALPVMEQRRRMWYDLNDARPGARPPVIVETWTFDRDFLPESLSRCRSRAGRAIERTLLRNIRNHELIDDDKVMPATFEVGWAVTVDEFGVKIERETVKDSQGYDTGYKFLHPIKDLRRDLAMLKPAVCTVDREATAARRAFMEELFDGILPVRQVSGVPGACRFLTQRVVELMGMESYFMAMYDCPDEMHALMAYLRDNALRIMNWAQAEGLLCLNNENEASFGSSYNFTTQLPSPGYDGRARWADIFGSANSQETVGVSTAMFHEFCYPYYRNVCEPLGLLYYGCCEPAHPFWDDIRRLPHLKKVSISRWCDQRFMGEALRGSEVVFSRKPDPKFFAVDVALDEEAWSAHVRETLEATRDVFVEFIVRDVYTVHGDLSKPRRAVELARREIDRA